MPPKKHRRPKKKVIYDKPIVPEASTSESDENTPNENITKLCSSRNKPRTPINNQSQNTRKSPKMTVTRNSASTSSSDRESQVSDEEQVDESIRDDLVLTTNSPSGNAEQENRIERVENSETPPSGRIIVSIPIIFYPNPRPQLDGTSRGHGLHRKILDYFFNEAFKSSPEYYELQQRFYPRFRREIPNPGDTEISTSEGEAALVEEQPEVYAPYDHDEAASRASNHTQSVPNSQSHMQSQHVYNQNCPAHTQSSGGSPGVHSPIDEKKTSNHTPSVSNSQSHMQSQHVYNQNSQAHTQFSGGSPGVHSSSSTTPQANQPVDFNLAINYFNKIKQPPKPVNNERGSVKKPSAPIKAIAPTTNQSKQIQGIKRPAPCLLSPPIKEKQRSFDGYEIVRMQTEVEAGKKNPVPGSGSEEAVGGPSYLSSFELNLEDNPLMPTPNPNEIKLSKKTEVVPKKSEEKSEKKLASNQVPEKME